MVISLENFTLVLCGVMVVVGIGAEHYSYKHTRLTYKEQRVGVRTRWWRR